MLKIVAKNFADPNKMDEIVKLSRELVEATRREKGCVSYGMYQDVQHPELLTMMEEWDSRESLAAHMKSEHFTRIVPQLGKLMTKEAEMSVYQQII